jgi:hypothetical protein
LMKCISCGWKVATLCPPTGSRSATMTLHPSAAKRLEIASPKPLPPPVTMATLPARRVPRTLGSGSIVVAVVSTSRSVGGVFKGRTSGDSFLGN